MSALIEAQLGRRRSLARSIPVTSLTTCDPQELHSRSLTGLSLKTVFVMETAEDRLRHDSAAYGKQMAV